jgi:hypothetical protein
MYANIAFIFMTVIYILLTFGVAVLAWSKGYNVGRSEGYARGKSIARHISNGVLNDN